MRQRHRMRLDRHARIVEDDRRDRDAAARRRLEIEAGHAKGRIAHKVDAELVGCADLGADREPQARAELVRLAPPQIPARLFRDIKRQELVARAAGIMGDNRVLRRNDTLEFRHDEIRVDRPLLRPPFGFPAAEPLDLQFLDLLRCAVRGLLLADALLGGFGELRQNELGVAEDRDRSVVRLIKIARIVGAVNDLFSGRNDRRRDVVPGQRGADREDHIRLEQEMPAVPGIDDATRSQGQRMVFRKGALAVRRRHDRDVEELGECEQFGARLRIQHALSGDDDRVLRLDQHFRRVIDVARIAGRTGAAHGRVIDLVAGEFGGHHIGRHLDHDRAGAAVLQRVEGAPHCRHRVLGQQNRLDMLCHRGIGAGRIEQRKHLCRLARMAEREQQDRRRIRIGRGDAGKGVFGARPVLHRKYAGRLAVGDARAAIGHVHPDPLLPADHGAHAAGHRGLNDRRRREGEQGRDALALQDLGDRVHDQHRASLPMTVL